MGRHFGQHPSEIASEGFPHLRCVRASAWMQRLRSCARTTATRQTCGVWASSCTSCCLGYPPSGATLRCVLVHGAENAEVRAWSVGRKTLHARLWGIGMAAAGVGGPVLGAGCCTSCCLGCTPSGATQNVHTCRMYTWFLTQSQWRELARVGG